MIVNYQITDASIKNRFMLKVLKSKSAVDACWDWKTSTFIVGYGAFWYKGRQHSAHRISYRLFIGDIPKDLCILHKCDNRKCTNPSHLFLGTKKDNSEDMVRKGRWKGKPIKKGEQLGSKHYQTNLIENNIPKIREMAKDKVLHSIIAQRFNVSRACIRNILYKNTWTHVK